MLQEVCAIGIPYCAIFLLFYSKYSAEALPLPAKSTIVYNALLHSSFIRNLRDMATSWNDLARVPAFHVEHNISVISQQTTEFIDKADASWVGIPLNCLFFYTQNYISPIVSSMAEECAIKGKVLELLASPNSIRLGFKLLASQLPVCFFSEQLSQLTREDFLAARPGHNFGNSKHCRNFELPKSYLGIPIYS